MLIDSETHEIFFQNHVLDNGTGGTQARPPDGEGWQLAGVVATEGSVEDGTPYTFVVGVWIRNREGMPYR